MINLACKLGGISNQTGLWMHSQHSQKGLQERRPSPEWALTGTSGWWHRYKEDMLWGAAGPPAHLAPFSLSSFLSWFSISFFLPYLLLSSYPTSFFPSQCVVSACEYTRVHIWRLEEDIRGHPALSLSYWSPWDGTSRCTWSSLTFSDKLAGRSASPQDSLVSSMSSTSFRSSRDHVSLHMVGSGHLTSDPNACTTRFLSYLFSPRKSDLELDVRRQP